eukprot:4376118-Pyramimonas_sp.AAC.1
MLFLRRASSTADVPAPPSLLSATAGATYYNAHVARIAASAQTISNFRRYQLASMPADLACS